MHEPPHQRQPKQGRKQKPRTSQITSGRNGNDKPKRIRRFTDSITKLPGMHAAGVVNACQLADKHKKSLSQTKPFAQITGNRSGQGRDAITSKGKSGKPAHAARMLKIRQMTQTRQNFTRLTEVFDHFQAGDDRFGDLRHDDVPQVNPKSG